MTLGGHNSWEVDQWDLDQCRYCKAPIGDIDEIYCSSSCRLKWEEHLDRSDNSPSASSFFSDLADSSHAHPSGQSSARSSPNSSPSSTPAFLPVLPATSVPTFPLDSTPNLQRRHSLALRGHKYGSSLNPVKSAFFPSNYYQVTIGDRPAPLVYNDKWTSLGTRKVSSDDIRPKPTTTESSPDLKQGGTVDRAPTKKSSETTTPKATHSSFWSWRRLSTIA